ncbi:MAG: hypothetical protein N4J56_005548 [Chroococcidiopsis sp. SAG 2025]|uniref:DUF6887 family protein n=1 Tax=Chroococcidiopsis sp. SAG 2025 TaxID=171389 RepID=UPI00293742AD|nr:hypothetical protein [Chroococcidiopsis sp. SAG 2025]MDV2995894.1 hypothetical protein [Chroococcidiopsis sp. SAG 2025]
MSKDELRTYVIEHQDDCEAFYALADRLTAKSASKCYPASMPIEETQKIILDRIQQKQQSTETEK